MATLYSIYKQKYILFLCTENNKDVWKIFKNISYCILRVLEEPLFQISSLYVLSIFISSV